MTTREFDFSDESTRQSMGRALRANYDLGAPVPEHLKKLMEQLQQRLDSVAPISPTNGTIAAPPGDAARDDGGAEK